MAISNELNSEIVNALLSSKNRSPEELAELRDVLLKVHSTLESLRVEARQDHSTELKASAKVAGSE